MSLPEPLLTTILGCLLHDIGKPVQRARMGYRGTHSAIGRAFLKKTWLNDARNPSEFVDELNEEVLTADAKAVLDAVSYHHKNALRWACESRRLPIDAPAYITYIADNISAGADRRKEDSDDVEMASDWQPTTPLHSIFNKFGPQMGVETSYQPQLLDDREPINFPSVGDMEFDKYKYSYIVEKLEATLKNLELTPAFVTSLLSVLESTLTYVPSSTDASEVRDISLYDHLRLTGAFGSCIYSYLTEQGRSDFKSDLFDNASDFYKEDAFLLASFDVSGIQDFIYTIHSSGAARMLRAPSYYLEMLCEHLVDELLERLGQTMANLNYVGGGHAYLILPNTDATKQALANFEEQVNVWLLDRFATSLFLACGWTGFSANDIMREKDQTQARSAEKADRYSDLYREVSEQISAKKLARYSSQQIQDLNSARHEGSRECNVCYRVENSLKHVKDTYLCSLCSELSEASSDIQEKSFLVVASGDEGLPLPFGKSLTFASRDQAANLVDDGTRVYAKNKFYIGESVGTHLWVGDYFFSRDFSDYVRDATGIDRMAVVRMDVDNLGDAFVRGFAKQQDGKYNTISRTSQFSRVLSLFFRQHINYLLDNPKYRPISGEETRSRHATIIYSGGDDVFLVGSWDDCLEFAVELRDNFVKYTEGKLTLSAGIGIYPDKFPISVMAREVGELEDSAKKGDKDAICVFEPDMVFRWDEFRDAVLGDKYTTVKGFFKGNDERGKAFIYKLLQLLRERDDKISLARWVYFLSRMEPKENEKKQAFRKFSGQLHEWFQDSTHARQLKMALYLYIYATRDKKGGE